MYKEKVNALKEELDALLKEAFEATKKLLLENGDKTCVYLEDSDIVALDDGGGYTKIRGVRLAKGGQDPYGGWRTLQVFRLYIDGWGWCYANDISSDCYADLYDLVSKNLNNAITYEESKEL